MTCMTFDAALVAQLEKCQELVEIRDESGRTIGYFHPIRQSAARSVSTPFSREEIERRREQRTGRPLPEVLQDLPRP
jgi:hypothetical protein